MGKRVGYSALWVLVIIVAVWAHSVARNHRKTERVAQMSFTVEGSKSKPLVDASLMEEWVVSHGVSPIGRTIAEVDLFEIESVVLQHSAVSAANAYISYDGSVSVSITQREPVARLRVDGYDMYLTADGYLFPADDGNAVYVPVITGSYRPIFAANRSCYASDVVRDSIAAIDRHIAALDEQKLPFMQKRQAYRKEFRAALRQRVKRTLFMSDYEYDKRNEELKELKAEARRLNVERNRRLDYELAQLTAQQDAAREQQRMLGLVDEDMRGLLKLLSVVQHDSFWSSEVVQIILSGGGTEPMQISFVPRSGRFVVDMGFAERIDHKFNTLWHFYHKGLDNVGWDKYRQVSLRYEGQVVCR